jgi:hypothetical protein
MVSQFTYDAVEGRFSSVIGTDTYIGYSAESGYVVKAECAGGELENLQNALEVLLAVIRPLVTAQVNGEFGQYEGKTENEVEVE